MNCFRISMTRIVLLSSVVGLLSRTSFAEDDRHFKKAEEAYKQQIYLSAISEARAQIRETPNHAPSWQLISRAYLTLKKCSEATNAAAAAYHLTQSGLEPLLSDLDARCGTSLELARIYSQSKEYPKASKHYQGYLHQNPDDTEIRLEYARVLTWAKEYPSATEQFKSYLATRPNDVSALLGLADVYSWSGDLPAASAQLKKALALDPNNADAIAKLGRVYEWQGNFKSAKDEYDKAVAIAPKNETARDGQGRVKDMAAASQKTTYSSDSILDEIQRTGHLDLYFNLGNALYHNEGKVEEALRAYRRYLREFPDDSAALLKVARVLGWEKRYDESIPLYRQYLKKSPTDFPARLELANILAWNNRYAEALTELDLIKKHNPSWPAPYLAAGEILRWQRSFPEARDNYRKVLRLEPDNLKARDGLYEIEQQWTADPALHLIGENIAVSDIHFRRNSVGVQGEFHVNDGRIDVTPEGTAYEFRQGDKILKAQSAYLNGGFPIQSDWRWWGGVGGLKVENRPAQFQSSLGIEGTISTHTWIRMGYTGADAVFESNNLTALLNGSTLRLDSYDLQFARVIQDDNQIKGALSAGFLTDGNSRVRLMLEGLHQLTDAPIIKVGAAFKALSFAQTSPLYWSPAAYSGPGVSVQLERRWVNLSYRAGLKIFRIIQTSQTETAVEGGLTYHQQHGFLFSLTGETGHGAGSAAQQTTNTVYQAVHLKAGYKF